MTRTPVSNAQVLEINWSQLLKSKGRSDGSSDLNVSKGVLIAAGAVFLAALGEVSSSDRQPRHDRKHCRWRTIRRATLRANCHAILFWLFLDLTCKLEMHLAIFSVAVVLPLIYIECHVRVQLSLRLPHIFRGEWLFWVRVCIYIVSHARKYLLSLLHRRDSVYESLVWYEDI